MYIINFISQEKTSDGIESEQLIDIDLGLSSAISGHPTRKVTLTSCSCLFPSCWGLPCRHMLLVYHHEKMTLVPDNAISDFWKVSYLDRLYCSNHGRRTRGAGGLEPSWIRKCCSIELHFRKILSCSFFFKTSSPMAGII